MDGIYPRAENEEYAEPLLETEIIAEAGFAVHHSQPSEKEREGEKRAGYLGE